MFFQRNKAHVKHFALSVHDVYQRTKDSLTNLFNSIVSRRLRINLKLDVKGPYIVFPELGSLQELVTSTLYNTDCSSENAIILFFIY